MAWDRHPKTKIQGRGGTDRRGLGPGCQIVTLFGVIEESIGNEPRTLGGFSQVLNVAPFNFGSREKKITLARKIWEVDLLMSLNQKKNFVGKKDQKQT